MNHQSVGNPSAQVANGSTHIALADPIVINGFHGLLTGSIAALEFVKILRVRLSSFGFKLQRVTLDGRLTVRKMTQPHCGDDFNNYAIFKHNRMKFPSIFWNHDVFTFYYKGVTFFGLVTVEAGQAKFLCLPDIDNKEMLDDCYGKGWHSMPSEAVHAACNSYSQYCPETQFREIQANEDFPGNFALLTEHKFQQMSCELVSRIRAEYLEAKNKLKTSREKRAAQRNITRASPPQPNQNRRRRADQPAENARPRTKPRLETAQQQVVPAVSQEAEWHWPMFDGLQDEIAFREFELPPGLAEFDVRP